MRSEPTVFVLDPDGLTRDTVRNLVYTMNLRCEAYASGLEFLDAFAPSRPGCVVLEVKIPDINGLQIQQRLASEGAMTPVVFLAEQATVSIAVRAMRAGAVHFLEKPLREHELWDTIQEAIDIDRQRRAARMEEEELKERLATLKPKERRVLELVAEGKSKRHIAAEIGVSVRTIGLRQTELMKKLDLESPTDLLRFALLVLNGHARRGDGLPSASTNGNGQ